MLTRVACPMFCASASGTEQRYVILRTASACGGAHPFEQRVAMRFVGSCCREPTHLVVLLHGEGTTIRGGRRMKDLLRVVIVSLVIVLTVVLVAVAFLR